MVSLSRRTISQSADNLVNTARFVSLDNESRRAPATVLKRSAAEIAIAIAGPPGWVARGADLHFSRRAQ
jgi:hypothetical protein